MEMAIFGIKMRRTMTPYVAFKSLLVHNSPHTLDHILSSSSYPKIVSGLHLFVLLNSKLSEIVNCALSPNTAHTHH